MKHDLKVLDSLFEALPSGVLIYDEYGTVIQINSRAKELLKLSIEEAYPSLKSLPENLNELKERLSHATEDISRAEINLMFPGEESSSVIGFTLKRVTLGDDEEKPFRIFIFNDITHIVQERLAMDRIKDELFQSKKLASIGTMISGVAHELNNPLTGISMSTQLSEMILRSIIKKLDPNEDARIVNAIQAALKELEKSDAEAKKAAVLVSDLLNYSKPSQLALSLENPIKIVSEMVLTIKSHPEFSQIEFIVGDYPQPIDVLCDRIKIEQVFYNLFKNASDAMGHKGQIKIAFSDTRDHANQSRMIQMSVIDTGPGIDKSLLTRIFDPFFTTKGAEGVGLGLSISFRTIEQHGGLLSAESEKGKGTHFHIALPLLEDDDDMII